MIDKTLQEILDDMLKHTAREQEIVSWIGYLNCIAPIAFIMNIPIAFVSGIWLLFYTNGTRLVYMSIISWFVIPYFMGILTFPAKYCFNIHNKKIASILIALIHWLVVFLWGYFAIAEEIIHGYSLSLGHIPTVALCTSMSTLPIWRVMQDFFKLNCDEQGTMSAIILAFAELASLVSILIFFILVNLSIIQDIRYIRFVVIYVFAIVGILEIDFYSKILMEDFYYQFTTSITNEAQQINEKDSINEPVSEQTKLYMDINIKTKESEQQKIFIPYYNIVDKLVYIGLACIGRKTKAFNQYLTNDKKRERYSVERPFLELLSYKFKADNQRKILAKNFMFFKETLLFVIYSVLLRENTELYNLVKMSLGVKLSEGLSSSVNQTRNDYFKLCSRKIYDTFAKTRNMNEALRFSFWSTLAEKYPDWITLEGITDILNNDHLFKIFKYSYDAINREYRIIGK